MTRVAVRSLVVLVLGLGCASAWAGQDEEAIQAVIIESARATSEFSRTRDTQSVLSMYAKDYVGVQDGEAETVDTIQKWLADYGAELDQGSPVRFLGEVYGIKVRRSGPIAWATYDYVFKLVSDGKIQAEDRGLCTSILHKEGSAWLIQHEHCSKPRPAK